MVLVLVPVQVRVSCTLKHIQRQVFKKLVAGWQVAGGKVTTVFCHEKTNLRFSKIRESKLFFLMKNPHKPFFGCVVVRKLRVCTCTCITKTNKSIHTVLVRVVMSTSVLFLLVVVVLLLNVNIIAPCNNKQWHVLSMSINVIPTNNKNNNNQKKPTTTTTTTISTSETVLSSTSSSSTRRILLFNSIPTSIILSSAVDFAEATAAETDTTTTTTTTAKQVQQQVLQPNGIAYRLQQRNTSVLKNKIFNIPPTIQIYPNWMIGEWNIQSKFSGYAFPSTKISREKLVTNYNIAGFQKCSIVPTVDVGKEGIVQYKFKINTNNNSEDRIYNIQNSINAYLGYSAINSIVYDPITNPNRISINFINYKTINAEQIELFYNARESEEYVTSKDNTTHVFVHSEFVRQVTFGTGSTVGIPRQVITNYANYYTWIWDSSSLTTTNETQKDSLNSNIPQTLRGNLLTVAYLDPQDPMYFDEPQKPVAVYSHSLVATRIV